MRFSIYEFSKQKEKQRMRHFINYVTIGYYSVMVMRVINSTVIKHLIFIFNFNFKLEMCKCTSIRILVHFSR